MSAILHQALMAAYPVAGGGGPTDPNFANVSLLLHMDGANGSTTFTDSSSNPKTVSRFGDAQISTAQSKFGGASAYFDGTGDYLSVPGDNDFAFGTGDFTVEFWLRQDFVGSSNRDIVTFGPNWEIYTSATGQVFLWNGSTNIINSATGVISANTWHHVAVTRSSGNVRLFVDGVQRGSTAAGNSTNFTNAQAFYVNFYPGNFWRLIGYVDELRLTKGVARYTANFTPPTGPFPDA
jgi:hypothetical protein